MTGGTPLEAGSRVGLSVHGSVVAWPIDERAHTHGHGHGHEHGYEDGNGTMDGTVDGHERAGHDHANTDGRQAPETEAGPETEHGGASRP